MRGGRDLTLNATVREKIGWYDPGSEKTEQKQKRKKTDNTSNRFPKKQKGGWGGDDDREPLLKTNRDEGSTKKEVL